jgi:hypothetical protein
VVILAAGERQGVTRAGTGPTPRRNRFTAYSPSIASATSLDPGISELAHPSLPQAHRNRCSARAISVSPGVNTVSQDGLYRDANLGCAGTFALPANQCAEFTHTSKILQHAEELVQAERLPCSRRTE